MSELIFRGRIPNGFLFDADYNMWLQRAGDEVVVGATSFGLFLAGTVIAFTPKPLGAQVACTRGFGTVECAKTVLALRAPLSFVLVEANEDAEEHPGVLNRDPYHAGWMVRARPTAWDAEHAGLIDAAAYRAHVAQVEPGAKFE